MVDESAVGRVGQPFDMVVERGKIREFARATLSASPEYLDDPVPVSPPTFLVNAAFWTPPGENPLTVLGLDLRRLLHGAQEFVFHGPPPRAGAELHARTRVDKVYEKEGRRGGTMTFVETVTEFRDGQGALVAEARSTAIETARAPEES